MMAKYLFHLFSFLDYNSNHLIPKSKIKMAPPLYADLGKTARDIFNKGYSKRPFLFATRIYELSFI